MKTVNDLMEKVDLIIDSRQSVSRLLGKLDENRGTDIFISEGSRVKGVFSPMTVLRSHVNTKEIKLSHAVEAVPQLRPDYTLLQAAHIFQDQHALALPVIEGQRLKGRLTLFRVAKELAGLTEEKVLLEEIKKPFPFVRESERLAKAIHLMHDNNLHELPVLSQVGQPIGIIRSIVVLKRYYLYPFMRDYSQQPNTPTTIGLSPEKYHLIHLAVKNFMDSSMVYIDHLGSVQECVDLLVAKNRRYLFQKEGSALYAISLFDITKKLMESHAQILCQIQYIGLNELTLSPQSKEKVEYICLQHAQKVQRLINKPSQLVFHFKEYERTGAKHRYDLHVRLFHPGSILVAEVTNWNILTAIQEGIEELVSRFHHQRGKAFSPRNMFPRGSLA